MKEFITHPQITRIFAKEIEHYGIKSIILDEYDFYRIRLSGVLPDELYDDIKHAAITAKYEDEAAIDPHEDSDTIKAAILQRQK